MGLNIIVMMKQPMSDPSDLASWFKSASPINSNRPDSVELGQTVELGRIGCEQG